MFGYCNLFGLFPFVTVHLPLALCCVFCHRSPQVTGSLIDSRDTHTHTHTRQETAVRPTERQRNTYTIEAKAEIYLAQAIKRKSDEDCEQRRVSSETQPA